MSAQSAVALLLLSMSSRACADCLAHAQITVKIWNEAPITDQALRAAEKEAAWVLRSLCVDVVWAPCPISKAPNAAQCAGPSEAIEMHILASPITADASKDAMGIAMPHAGDRKRAAVFSSRVRAIARRFAIIDEYQLLGCVIAHELGHILLHSTAHSREGVMRAMFREEDLKKAVQRQLVFTKVQRDAIRGTSLNIASLAQ